MGKRKNELHKDLSASESVEGSALPFQGVNNIHGCHGLSPGVLCVCDGIPDHILQEDLQDASGLFINEAADTLDASSPGQTPDGGLGDTLDIISENFPVPLGTSFPQTLASLSTPRHLSFLAARRCSQPK